MRKKEVLCCSVFMRGLFQNRSTRNERRNQCREWARNWNTNGRCSWTTGDGAAIWFWKGCPIITICVIFPAPHPAPDYRTNRTYRTEKTSPNISAKFDTISWWKSLLLSGLNSARMRYLPCWATAQRRHLPFLAQSILGNNGNPFIKKLYTAVSFTK